MRGIGDGLSGLLRRAMFGNDEFARANDDVLFALPDQHGLPGILGRQRVAAARKAHEAIEAGLPRNEFAHRITRGTVQRAHLKLGRDLLFETCTRLRRARPMEQGAHPSARRLDLRATWDRCTIADHAS